MVVLGAVAGTVKNTGVQEFLAERRQGMQATILARLRQGVHDGDLPPEADLPALAAFYMTVLQGMSLQSRDGASRDVLETVVTCAMAAWDALAGARAEQPA
ncbi:hypothetical protein [Actinomadura macrotermitis]|uniref:TetR family transcriptional regulator n=1 Tax=Actinomadura macrotermitis TaxID=2585200 RepID=A0A7K0C2S2_9ACTN|nr:hypothetical protein [Actinomadura macrotermitis]MQY07731.1 hypothetical protein [Actinomadura macrotermitis]